MNGAPSDIILPFDNNDYVPNLPFEGRSIYGKDFGPKRGERAKSFKQAPRRRKDIRIPLNTTYGENFGPKGWSHMGRMGPLDIRVPNPKGDFDTEYRTQYPAKHGHELNKCHYKHMGQP